MFRYVLKSKGSFNAFNLIVTLLQINTLILVEIINYMLTNYLYYIMVVE